MKEAAVAAVAGGSGSGETVFPTDTKHTVGPPKVLSQPMEMESNGIPVPKTSPV